MIFHLHPHNSRSFHSRSSDCLIVMTIFCCAHVFAQTPSPPPPPPPSYLPKSNRALNLSLFVQNFTHRVSSNRCIIGTLCVLTFKQRPQSHFYLKPQWMPRVMTHLSLRPHQSCTSLFSHLASFVAPCTLSYKTLYPPCNYLSPKKKIHH